MRKFFGLLLFLAIFSLYPKPTFAANEFATSYDTSYDIGEDGVAEVTQKISLKNLTDQYYASNFTLSIGSTAITDVLAFDKSGDLETKVENKGTKTSVSVKFNEQVAGIDKVQTFTLKLRSRDFAQKIGRTWEVNLPKIPEGSNIENYKLTLSVPFDFGDPTSILPTPSSQSQSFDKYIFNFSKEQLEKSGVSVNFGTNQVFDFILKYNLNNPSFLPLSVSISLPPDTEYQDVILNNISPRPTNITIDSDGNYLAWFDIKPRVNQEVVASGSAKLYINAKNQKVYPLNKTDLGMLTKSDKYWEKDNPQIAAVLLEIFKDNSPKKTSEKVKMIYQYVVKTLQYDDKRLTGDSIERLGALTALNNPTSAVCMEFTDLFVTLTRAAGIPARELDGYAYTQNQSLRPLSLSKDLLHAWAEYYDNEKGWIMVDPTWENTSGGVDYFNKFDLNHLVLAKKGISSIKPAVSNDVKVTISDAEFISISDIKVSFDAPDYIWAGFPANINVRILNQGNTLQPPAVLSLNSNQIKILEENSVGLGAIPPFGSTNYKFKLKSSDLFKSFDDVVEVNVAGQKYTKKITIKPFFMVQPFPYLFLGMAILILGIYGGVLGIHVYQKRILRIKKDH